jgi:hypothetical protein
MPDVHGTLHLNYEKKKKRKKKIEDNVLQQFLESRLFIVVNGPKIDTSSIFV